MSTTIKTMHNSALLDMDGDPIDPRRGDLVRSFYTPKSIGIVVDRPTPIESAVLWSDYKDPFEGFVLPQRMNYTQIAKDLITVQPMTGPSALPIYLDYTLKDDEE